MSYSQNFSVAVLVGLVTLFILNFYLIASYFQFKKKCSVKFNEIMSLSQEMSLQIEKKISEISSQNREEILSETEDLIDDKVVTKFEDDSSSMDAILLVLNKISKSLPELVEEQNREKNKVHDLAIMFINRINFMYMTVLHMDESTKGLKQLKYVFEDLNERLKEFGYEVPELINTSYQEGLKLSANFVNSDTVPVSSRIISNVQKPAVYFKGEILQTAEVTVTQNLSE